MCATQTLARPLAPTRALTLAHAADAPAAPAPSPARCRARPRPHARPLARSLAQVCKNELLLDDALIFAEYCAAAGSEVAVQQYDQALHAWHTYFPIMPVAEAALADVLDFLRAKLFGGPGGGGTAAALSSVAEADDE